MSSAMNIAIAQLADTLESVAGRSVVYRRGDTSLAIVAVVGDTRAFVLDGSGNQVEHRVRDYLIRSADLGGLEPRAGDRIEETEPGEGANVYEVFAPAGDAVARPSDPAGVVWRVHTQLVRTEAPA